MARPAGAASAVVIVTGSELVRGDRQDENGPYLARELSRLGLEPVRVVLVGDRPERLTAAVREGLAEDVCVISGGLGPTHDDRTLEILAAELGRELAVDEALVAEIEAFSRGVAERLGRPYADFAAGVRKQASLPLGAVSLGLAGTAPAVLLAHDGGVAVALPGPPVELRNLWPRAREHPAFRRAAGRARPRSHRRLRLFGPSESAVARVLAEAGGEEGGLEITVCARDLEVHVDVFAPAGARAAARARQVANALHAAFGDELFADGDERPVETLVLEACRRQRLTLATAESCTGGLVAARLTAVPGASDVFLGGVIAYADDVKRARLDVPPDVLEAHGAVSAETAAAMAAGARTEVGADVAAAVTGVAGPGGGSPEKPVGLVFVAIETPGGVSIEEVRLPGDRDAVRARATALALHALRRLLTRTVPHPRA